MAILGLALALLVGLSLGVLGGGGSILTVPILVYVLGFGAKRAIAMSLAVVCVTSLVGATRHRRTGKVDLRIALIFGPMAMFGAYLGARLSVFFSGSAQLALFAGVMLLAAVFMLRDTRPAGTPRERLQPSTVVLIVAGALGVGVLTGLVGVGGGFLIVPVLVLLIGVPMKQAVGTSLLVIALNSFAGFLGYVGQVSVDWGFMVAFAAVAVTGIWIGAHMVSYISQRALKRAFAVFLLVMGTWILIQNRGAFRPEPAAAGTLAPR